MPNNIYTDNVSDKELEAGYWYVKHRVMLRRILIVVIGGLAGVLIFFGIRGLFVYFVEELDSRSQIEMLLVHNNMNYKIMDQLNHPFPIDQVNVKMLESGPGRFNIIAEVVNPNTIWTIDSVEYYFTYGDRETEHKKAFILPGANKFLLEMNIEEKFRFSTPSLVLLPGTIVWRKVSNFTEKKERMLQFGYDNINVLTPKMAKVSSKIKISTIDFDINNLSPFNYWQPKFIILIYRGTSLVGVNQLELERLNTQERVSRSINVFQSLSLGTDVRIYADINILDPNVFMGFGRNVNNPKY